MYKYFFKPISNINLAKLKHMSAKTPVDLLQRKNKTA